MAIFSIVALRQHGGMGPTCSVASRPDAASTMAATFFDGRKHDRQAVGPAAGKQQFLVVIVVGAVEPVRDGGFCRVVAMPGETLDERIDDGIGAFGHDVALCRVHRMRNAHERQIRHAPPGRLFARGGGESRAEHGNGRNTAAFDFDRIGDTDRGRGAAIAETLHDGVALREIGEIVIRQPILRRSLAHDRTWKRGVSIAQVARPRAE